MTPPLPLAELVQKWEERSRKCYADGEYTAEYHLDRCIDELRALPLGRCETCREWDSYTTGEHGWCDALKMTTMRQFGCTTYASAPPAAGEETR